MAEIAFVITGKPQKGSLPPLKRVDEKPEMKEDPEDKEPGKKASREDAGFWDEAQPHTCDTCGCREGTGCEKVEGVDFDESDQTLSGCSMWQSAESEDEGEETEE